MSSQEKDNQKMNDEQNDDGEDKIHYHYWTYKGVSKRGHFVKGEKKGDNERLIVE
jgi:hypothetical protein